MSHVEPLRRSFHANPELSTAPAWVEDLHHPYRLCDGLGPLVSGVMSDASQSVKDAARARSDEAAQQHDLAA